MKLQIEAEEKVYNQSSQPKEKGRTAGFFALVLTTLWTVCALWYYHDLGIDTLVTYAAVSIVTPHLICITLATIFAFVGYFGRKRWAMLTSGILMAVSAVLMLDYLQYVIVQAILFFVSYARMES